ncbi:MAG: GAF and ANTAR domain-containing protein [Ilumatobacteraceae bacterium]
MPAHESKPTLRLERTADTFVEIVDTLVRDFDVIEVLTVLTSRCVELLDAAAAGILLADDAGNLRVVGASTEQIHLLELFQVQNEEGPCLDCFRTGKPVISSDLRSISPWPTFAAECIAAGFLSVCAVPLRLKGATLGCLNLFMRQAAALSDADVALAQALADVASITMVQEQAARQVATQHAHLRRTLNGRIAIEQAKGMIAESAGLGMDAAFARLRHHAEARHEGPTAIAEALVSGAITVSDVTG